MLKLKELDMNNTNIEQPINEEEFDIEFSHEVSLEFLRYSVAPLIENFENDPPSEEYCSGTLIYNLFLYATNEMIKAGWSKEELTSELSNFYDYVPDDQENSISINDFPDPENPTIN
jgi:hypothetical protein